MYYQGSRQVIGDVSKDSKIWGLRVCQQEFSLHYKHFFNVSSKVNWLADDDCMTPCFCWYDVTVTIPLESSSWLVAASVKQCYARLHSLFLQHRSRNLSPEWGVSGSLVLIQSRSGSVVDRIKEIIPGYQTIQSLPLAVSIVQGWSYDPCQWFPLSQCQM